MASIGLKMGLIQPVYRFHGNVVCSSACTNGTPKLASQYGFRLAFRIDNGASGDSSGSSISMVLQPNDLKFGRCTLLYVGSNTCKYGFVDRLVAKVLLVVTLQFVGDNGASGDSFGRCTSMVLASFRLKLGI